MTNVMEAAEGSSGAQQCLRGCCRIHWGAVIQQSSAGEREHLEASVGVEQPIPRVNVNQSKRVRGRGDQGLGLERSAVQSKPSAGSAFFECCLLHLRFSLLHRRRYLRALAELFMVLAVGVLGQHIRKHGRLVPKGNHSPHRPGHWDHCLF